MTHQEKLKAVYRKIVEAAEPKRQLAFDMGKDPSIADVLLGFVKSNDGILRVDQHGFFELSDEEGEELGPPWNLRQDSLDDQSEEMISFLHQLLCQ